MASSRSRRRIATVLFLDIVGSTAVASDLGDAGWQVVLARFRAVVRQELKRGQGREQDTTGDGFFATFAEPARALVTAASVLRAVQDLGLDVRLGLHTGECEEIDGKPAGLAVHIGARVMAIAGPAEVLVTQTTRDLVAGSGAGFEEAGSQTLKGVEGRWLLSRLVSVAERLPKPLDADVAAGRLAEVVRAGHRRRRWPLVAAGGTALLLAVAVGSFAAINRGGHTATASLIRLDPSSGRVVATVRDGQIGCGCGANLWAVDGTLWERGGSDGRTIAERTLTTGALRRTFQLPTDETGFAIGDGAVWIARDIVAVKGPKAGTIMHAVERLDELSGRRTALIRLPSEAQTVTALAVGGGAVWALDSNATLFRIDPATHRITGRFATGAIETQILIPTGRYVWICECVDHEAMRFDPRTATAKTFQFAQQPWYLVSVAARRRNTLWLLDGKHATITQLDPVTGRRGPPLGLAGNPTEAVLARGSIWVAAGKIVDRVRLTSGARTTITLPKGTHATGIAVDPATETIWVDNSRPAES